MKLPTDLMKELSGKFDYFFNLSIEERRNETHKVHGIMCKEGQKLFVWYRNYPKSDFQFLKHIGASNNGGCDKCYNAFFKDYLFKPKALKTNPA